MPKVSFLSTIILLFYYINSIICQQLSARRNADTQSLNVEHISLDLTELHGITELDDSKIQWKTVTDVLNSTQTTLLPRSYVGTAAVTSDNSYVMYGGVISDSFLNYNPQTYTWRTLQVDPNINITNRDTLVNMGDDKFWLWGGENFPNYTVPIPNMAFIYDYKAARWVNQIVDNSIPMRTEHTATLGLDGGIYVLGGAIRYPGDIFYYSNFSEIRKFDTKSSQWSYFNATGHPASSRASHTTTQLPNKNQMLIYGGVNADPAILATNNGRSVPSLDYCIIFDYNTNTFQNIGFPPLPNSGNIRYGHFAEIYNETYIVMAFGFVDETRPATTLSVLNITNPSSPQWVRSFSPLSNDSNADNTNVTGGLSGGIIAAIVVPVVFVVLIAIAVVIYFYKKKEKKKYKFPKDPFVIDESDPRLNTKDNAFNNIPPGGPNENTEDSQTTTYIKPSEGMDNDKYIKPSENNDISSIKLTDNFVKPSEYFNKPFGNEK
ncbi:hypothetical protein BJ944DRAFT_240398 [Cunninghamella echinulata]|nr:hypothetical protein BJ944DRAFT_240398 [Cunninghamella echinulata]